MSKKYVKKIRTKTYCTAVLSHKSASDMSVALREELSSDYSTAAPALIQESNLLILKSLTGNLQTSSPTGLPLDMKSLSNDNQINYNSPNVSGGANACSTLSNDM